MMTNGAAPLTPDDIDRLADLCRRVAAQDPSSAQMARRAIEIYSAELLRRGADPADLLRLTADIPAADGAPATHLVDPVNER